MDTDIAVSLSQSPAKYAVVAVRNPAKWAPAYVFGYTDDFENAIQASRELAKTAYEGETVSPVKVHTYGRRLAKMSKERLHSLGLI